MTLKELQDVLGAQVQTVQIADKEDEVKFAEVMDKADMIARLAKQMINNADVILRTDKLIGEGKLSGSTIQGVIG